MLTIKCRSYNVPTLIFSCFHSSHFPPPIFSFPPASYLPACLHVKQFCSNDLSLSFSHTVSFFLGHMISNIIERIWFVLLYIFSAHDSCLECSFPTINAILPSIFKWVFCVIKYFRYQGSWWRFLMIQKPMFNPKKLLASYMALCVSKPLCSKSQCSIARSLKLNFPAWLTKNCDSLGNNEHYLGILTQTHFLMYLAV